MAAAFGKATLVKELVESFHADISGLNAFGEKAVDKATAVRGILV